MDTTVSLEDGEKRATVRPVVRVGIVGEVHPGFPPHHAVLANLAEVCSNSAWEVHSEWVATDSLDRNAEAMLENYDAIWISPGSPYRSLEGALAAIRYARERQVPLLGTCGGFQHVVVEFGRNVMGLDEASHEETDPDSSCLIVTALTCSPAGKAMPVQINPDSRVASWYGRNEIVEQYYCNYGINPAYEREIDANGLRVVARDEANEPRVVDLDGHPFFVGALFVPEPAPDKWPAHPLVMQLVAAGARRRVETDTSPQPAST